MTGDTHVVWNILDLELPLTRGQRRTNFELRLTKQSVDHAEAKDVVVGDL